MKQIVKISLLLLVSGVILSCDYSTIKKENEDLRKENEMLKSSVAQLEQAELRRKKEEEYKLYLESIKKYAVVVVKYNSIISVSSNNGAQYEVKKRISDVIEVPSNITEDEKYKLMDKNTPIFSTSIYGYKSYVLDKKIHVFDRYSEASDFMTRERSSNN